MEGKLLAEWELIEAARYDALYQRGYPPGGIGFPIKWLHERFGFNLRKDARRVLDVGCGTAQLSRFIPEYIGLDVSSYIIEQVRQNPLRPGTYYVCGLSAAPGLFSTYHFDAIVCFDMFEHIPPDRIDESIDALSKLNAPFVLASICCRNAAIRDCDDNQIHQTVQPMMWWTDKLREQFQFVAQSLYNRQRTFAVVFGNEESALDWQRPERR